jgi:hypothetical protein
MPKTYEPISTQTLGTAVSSITFSSIPQTYTDLILVSNPINTGTTAVNIYFNSDTGTNYSCTRFYGGGGLASSDRFSNTASSLGGWGTGASSNPYVFISQIMSYTNTSINKSMITRANELTGGYSGAISTLWRNTAAITSVSFTGNANFGVGSVFTLYGIKAA